MPISLSELKQKNPAYARVPDAELFDYIHAKYYPGMDKAALAAEIDYTLPEPPASFGRKAINTGEELVQGVADLPTYTKGYIANLLEGTHPLDTRDWADVAAEESQRLSQERASSPDSNEPTLLGPRGAWRNTFQSAPFSIGGMGGAALGGIIGNALGGGANPVTAYAGGAATSGAMAYRADAAQFMRQALTTYADKYQQEFNRPPSEKELLGEQNRLQEYAAKHGLAEAAFEGLSTPLELGILKKVFKSDGGLIKKGLKAVAKIAAIELPTEAATEQSQTNTQIEAGLQEGPERSWLSPTDLGKSWDEVFYPVVQSSLLFGGVASGAKAIKNMVTMPAAKVEDIGKARTVDEAIANAEKATVEIKPENVGKSTIQEEIDARYKDTGYIPGEVGQLWESPAHKIIQSASAQSGMPANFLNAVHQVESSGQLTDSNGNTIRPVDKNGKQLSSAVGPMQIIPRYWPQFNANRLANDPVYNIHAGAEILSQLYNKTDPALPIAERLRQTAKRYYGSKDDAQNDQYAAKVLRKLMGNYEPLSINQGNTGTQQATPEAGNIAESTSGPTSVQEETKPIEAAIPEDKILEYGNLVNELSSKVDLKTTPKELEQAAKDLGVYDKTADPVQVLFDVKQELTNAINSDRPDLSIKSPDQGIRAEGQRVEPAIDVRPGRSDDGGITGNVEPVLSTQPSESVAGNSQPGSPLAYQSKYKSAASNYIRREGLKNTHVVEQNPDTKQFQVVPKSQFLESANVKTNPTPEKENTVEAPAEKNTSKIGIDTNSNINRNSDTTNVSNIANVSNPLREGQRESIGTQDKSKIESIITPTIGSPNEKETSQETSNAAQKETLLKPFAPTHELSDGTPVIAGPDAGTWLDADNELWQDDYATPVQQPIVGEEHAGKKQSSNASDVSSRTQSEIRQKSEDQTGGSQGVREPQYREEGIQKPAGDIGQGVEGEKRKVAEKKTINPKTDTLIQAIAKAGGINSDTAIAEGIDKAAMGRKSPHRSGVMLAFNRGESANSFDGMAETLRQYGYQGRNGKELDANELLAMVTESVNQGVQHRTPEGAEAHAEKMHQERYTDEQAQVELDLKNKLESGEITVDDLHDALDEVDNLTDKTLTGHDAINFLDGFFGERNDKATTQTGDKGFDSEALQDYTEQDLAEKEKIANEQAKKAANEELRAKQHTSADRGIDTLSDEMLGNVGNINLFGDNPLQDLGKAEPVKQSAPKVSDKQIKSAQFLRKSAESILSKAQEEQNRDRNTNTVKRAREASGAIERANKQEALAKTALNLADAIESGEAKALYGVKSMTQIETLNELLRSAMYLRDKNLSYMEQQKTQGRKPEHADLSYVQYPSAEIHQDNMPRLKAKLREVRGGKGLADSIHSNVLTQEQYDKIKKLLGDKEAEYSVGWYLIDRLKMQGRLQRMGINNTADLENALAEYMQFKEGAKGIDKIKAAEMALVGQKVGIDFFPTPKTTAEKMVDLAGIEKGMDVLEPSAGNGNLADAAKAVGANVDVIEISSALRNVLDAKGYNVVAHDFADFTPAKQYDAVIMNPPFSNGQDAEHIKRAYDMVNPGGKVVAIAGEGVFFRGDKKSQAFRDWLDEHNAEIEKLPAGTFNDKTLLNTTGVNARLIVIEKGTDNEIKETQKIYGISEGSDSAANAGWRNNALQKPKVVNAKVAELQTGLTKVNSPEDALHVIAPYRKNAQEQMLAVVLDEDNNIIQVIKHSSGLTGSSQVDAGILAGSIHGVEEAFSVYFAHNHPSGFSEHSKADNKITSVLSDLLRGTGIESKGMLVTVAGKGGTFANQDGENHRNIVPTIARRNKTIPVTERHIIRNSKISEESITSESQAQKVIRQLSDGKEGIVLTDTQNRPVSFIEMSANGMMGLRTNSKDSGAALLLKEIHDTNATAAFVNVHNDSDMGPINNVVAFFNQTGGIRFLDAIMGGESASSIGRIMGGSNVYFSKSTTVQNSFTKQGLTAYLTSKWSKLKIQIAKGDLVVYKNMDEVPANILRNGEVLVNGEWMPSIEVLQGNDQQPQGFYLNGKVYLLSDALNTDNVNSVVLHEYMHKALAQDAKLKERLLGLGSEFNVIFELVRSGEAKGEYGELYNEAARRVDMAETPAKNAREEFLTYSVSIYNENPKSLPARLRNAIRKLISIVKIAFYKSTGFIINPTPSDLSRFAVQAMGVESNRQGILNGSNAVAMASIGATPQQSALPKETNIEAIQRKFQDYYNRWQKIQQLKELEAAKKGGYTGDDIFAARRYMAEHNIHNPISNETDVYKAESVRAGIISELTKDFEEQTMKPLIKEAQEAGITMEEIAIFLIMQHAEEANIRIQKIKPDQPDATAYEVTTEQAHKVLADFEKRDDYEELARISNKWRGLTDKILDMKVDAGLIPASLRDAYQRTFNMYVPVKGSEEEGATTGTGKGLSVYNAEKRRLGHAERDERVIENIIKDYEKTINLIEKNKVTEKVYNFLNEVNDPTIGTVGKPVRRQVFKPGAKHYVVQYHGSDVEAFDNLNDARQFVDEESQKNGRNKSDFYIDTTQDDGRVILQAKPLLDDNEIQFYKDGKAIRLQINDELMARAAKNLGIEQMNKLIGGAQEFNRYLSVAYTGYSPTFMIKNPIRDSIQGLITNTSKLGFGEAIKIFTQYPHAMKELYRHFKTYASSNEVNRYRKAGGSTGAAYLPDTERIGKDIMDAYNEYAGSIDTYKRVYREKIAEGKSERAAKFIASRKAFKAGFMKTPVIGHVLNFMERANAITENALRLATFTTLVNETDANGNRLYSDLDAAAMAKDLMNFNRKGELTMQAGALYLFFNPNAQGTQVLISALKNSEHKYQARALAGTMVLSAFLMAELMRGGGDDDEEKWKAIPDDLKDRNMIFGAGNIKVMLPVPYGYGIFHSLGNAISDVAHGQSAYKAGIRMTSALFDNFSPFGNPIDSEHDLFQLMPTIPKMVMSPSVNENNFGSPIQPIKWVSSKPDSQNMYRGEKGTLYAGIAETMNNLSGGNKYKAGLVDVSPETIRYWFSSLLGGAGQFALDSINTASIIAQGDIPTNKNIPIVRAFTHEVGVTDARQAFWSAVNEADKAAQAFNDARKAGDYKAMGQTSKRDKALIALSHFANSQQKMAKTLRDAEDAIRLSDMPLAQKNMKIKALEKREEAVYNAFLKRFNN